MPIPDAKKSEDETNHLRISNDLVDGNGICISVDCKDTEAAAKWMDYLYTDDGRTLRTWGLEGLTLEKNTAAIFQLESTVTGAIESLSKKHPALYGPDCKQSGRTV